MVGPRVVRDKAAIEREFPIFPILDIETTHGQGSHRIGFFPRTEGEVKKKATAGAITDFLGNKSIDNVYRTYLKSVEFADSDESRDDLLITEFIQQSCSAFGNALVNFTQNEPEHIGVFAAQWTLLRVPFGFKIALSCANRGAFFETCTLCRSILEQMSWAYSIETVEDDDEFLATSSTKTFAHLKETWSPAGRFYGWLSEHAHWEHQRHKEALLYEGDKTFHVFANSTFKMRALAVLTILLEPYYAILDKFSTRVEGGRDALLSAKLQYLQQKEECVALFQAWNNVDSTIQELLKFIVSDRK